jgi:hypothetical protein
VPFRGILASAAHSSVSRNANAVQAFERSIILANVSRKNDVAQRAIIFHRLRAEQCRHGLTQTRFCAC